MAAIVCILNCGTLMKLLLMATAWIELGATYHAFHPGEVWLDTDGNRIRAHQPHVFGPLNGTYFWYGASKVGSSDGTPGIINLYTSSDLYNWQYRGVAYNCTTGYVARPSMLGRNPASGKFVLWAKGGGKSFQSAISDSPLGPFHFVGTFSPTSSSTAGDSASFRDPLSGSAFMVYSQHEPSRAIKVLTLTENWTGISADSSPAPTVVGHLEAPAPFYSPASGLHYIWTSHTSGWKPNPAALLSSKGMMGNWSSLGNPSQSKTTFGTQGSHVMSLGMHSSTHRLLYMGDRYEPYMSSSEGSRYIFLPMEVNEHGLVKLFNLDNKSWTLANWPGTQLFFA